MNERLGLAATVLEAVLLLVFFFSARQAERLALKGGCIDCAAAHSWNAVADYSFLLLVLVWVVAITAFLFQGFRTRSLTVLTKALPYRSAVTWALGLPLLGLFLGYLALASGVAL